MTTISFPFDAHHAIKAGITIILNQIKTISLSALFILIGISIIVAGSFLIAFLWSVGSGQYDDDYTPSIRMLFDDDIKPVTDIVPTKPLNQTK